MGLFSKKIYICSHCGKEYTSRLDFGVGLCNECYDKKLELEKQVSGYQQYNYSNTDTFEKIHAIIHRRNEILEKYQPENGISRAELQAASDNYRQLTEQEACDVLRRVQNSELTSTVGASFGLGIFVPTDGEGVVIDAQDVFAVAVTTATAMQSDGEEVIVCGVFTNDPYIPMFPMVFMGKLGFWEVSKSKGGREVAKKLFESLCPNLTYEVQDAKKLAAEIKREGEVRGNLSLAEMLGKLKELSNGKGGFVSEKKMGAAVHAPQTLELLSQYNFLVESDVNGILKMDKIFNRNFWNKQRKRLQEMEG